MSKTQRVLDLIEGERAKQEAKWGEQRHSDGVWLVILTEELGEASQTSLNMRPAETVVELIQAGAVIVAWIEQYLEDPLMRLAMDGVRVAMGGVQSTGAEAHT